MLSTGPVYLVHSSVSCNDNMTKFCTYALLCDAALRLPCLVLVGFGPRSVTLLKGQRLEPHPVEGSKVVASPCRAPKSVVV